MFFVSIIDTANLPGAQARNFSVTFNLSILIRKAWWAEEPRFLFTTTNKSLLIKRLSEFAITHLLTLRQDTTFLNSSFFINKFIDMDYRNDSEIL